MLFQTNQGGTPQKYTKVEAHVYKMPPRKGPYPSLSQYIPLVVPASHCVDRGELIPFRSILYSDNGYDA